MDRQWREIAADVYVRRYAFFDQTIGAIATPAGWVVVDTRTTPAHGAELLADLRALGPSPVAGVVHTHGHPDPPFGTSVFLPVPVWGHERCASMIRESWMLQRDALTREMPDLAGDLAGVQPVPPDHTFTATAALVLGERRIELRYLGRGHTDNDIVIIVPDASVLFAGDLLENGAPPYFGDAYPLDWPATAETLLGLTNEATVVVPGHGEPAGRAFARDQVEQLRSVAELARQIEAGDLDWGAALEAAPFGRAASREPLERAMAQLRGALDR
jgi:glyoxylase-like metal-dependent hydrolase (beta-lactamase superfamily II)